jgi:hypothetical protein
VLGDLVDGDDVGVGQAGGEPGLAAEALQLRGIAAVQNLEGDPAAGAELLRADEAAEGGPGGHPGEYSPTASASG